MTEGPPERTAGGPVPVVPPCPSGSPGGQGPQVPAGDAGPGPLRGEADGVPPAGQAPALPGVAWRKAVKAATSALHARQRRDRARYPGSGGGGRYRAGMARRTPPPPPPDGGTT